MGKEYESSTYCIKGMHCIACELLIEKELKELPNVKKIDISFGKKTVVIEHLKDGDNVAEKYNRILNTLGYTLSEYPHKKSKIKYHQQLAMKIVFSLVIIGLVYELLNYQWSFGAISITASSSLWAFFSFGLVAGVSSCAALVGGLLLSLSKQWNALYDGSSFVKRSTPFIMFNTGRLVSYAFLGGLLGVIGGTFQLSVYTTSLLVLVVSVMMILIGLQMLGTPWVSRIRLQLPSSITHKISAVESFKGKYMPFLAGASTFFLPCGFTLLVQAVALTTGSFTASSILMFLFVLGTLPPLVIISFSSIKFQNNPLFSSVFNFIVGIVIVTFGFYNLNGQLPLLGLPNFAGISTQLSIENAIHEMTRDAEGLGSELVMEDGVEVQKMYMRASNFEYFPRIVNLKANKKTMLTIVTDHVVGCAKVMFLQGLYDKAVPLNQAVVHVSFTPKKGKYYVSCTMGMVKPIIVNVF